MPRTARSLRPPRSRSVPDMITAGGVLGGGQHGHAVETQQPGVDHQRIETVGPEQVHGHVPVARLGDLVALVPQDGRDRPPGRVVVVGHQDDGGAVAGWEPSVSHRPAPAATPAPEGRFVRVL